MNVHFWRGDRRCPTLLFPRAVDRSALSLTPAALRFEREEVWHSCSTTNDSGTSKLAVASTMDIELPQDFKKFLSLLRLNG